MSSYWNMTGVITSERPTSMRCSSASQVDVRLDVAEGDVDLALVAGGDRSLDGVGGDRGVVGVGVDGQQRDRRAAGRHPVDQRDDPRVGLADRR